MWRWSRFIFLLIPALPYTFRHFIRRFISNAQHDWSFLLSICSRYFFSLGLHLIGSVFAWHHKFKRHLLLPSASFSNQRYSVHVYSTISNNASTAGNNYIERGWWPPFTFFVMLFCCCDVNLMWNSFANFVQRIERKTCANPSKYYHRYM